MVITAIDLLLIRLKGIDHACTDVITQNNKKAKTNIDIRAVRARRLAPPLLLLPWQTVIGIIYYSLHSKRANELMGFQIPTIAYVASSKSSTWCPNRHLLFIKKLIKMFALRFLALAVLLGVLNAFRGAAVTSRSSLSMALADYRAELAATAAAIAAPGKSRHEDACNT